MKENGLGMIFKQTPWVKEVQIFPKRYCGSLWVNWLQSCARKYMWSEGQVDMKFEIVIKILFLKLGSTWMPNLKIQILNEALFASAN